MALHKEKKKILSALCQMYLGNPSINKEIYFCWVMSLATSELKVIFDQLRFQLKRGAQSHMPLPKEVPISLYPLLVSQLQGLFLVTLPVNCLLVNFAREGAHFYGKTVRHCCSRTTPYLSQLTGTG